MQRRHFARWMPALPLIAATARDALARTAASGPANAKGVAPTKETADAHHVDAMQRHQSLLAGDKVVIGMLVYPGMYLQDLVGPLTVFESLMNREIHLLWKSLDPVGNEDPNVKAMIPVTPTTTFANCPEKLDVLFVPGGVPGTFTMMEDPEVLAFLAEKGKTARWVTSVCTGSLILGAAGLLKGYRATSYWSTVDALKPLGAVPVRQRVVVDRNRITGGGVTAGIDFGLKVAAELRSPAYAQAIQLYLEYDPAPPFNAGSPNKAPKAAKAFLDDMFAGVVETAQSLARKAGAKL